MLNTILEESFQDLMLIEEFQHLTGGWRAEIWVLIMVPEICLLKSHD